MSARIAMHQTIRTAGEAVTFFYMQYRMKSRLVSSELYIGTTQFSSSTV